MDFAAGLGLLLREGLRRMPLAGIRSAVGVPSRRWIAIPETLAPPICIQADWVPVS